MKPTKEFDGDIFYVVLKYIFIYIQRYNSIFTMGRRLSDTYQIGRLIIGDDAGAYVLGWAWGNGQLPGPQDETASNGNYVEIDSRCYCHRL